MNELGWSVTQVTGSRPRGEKAGRRGVAEKPMETDYSVKADNYCDQYA